MTQVMIIGTKGVPNKYGGFERFVEILAPFLVRAGHEVTVICESRGARREPFEDRWEGVRRLHIQAGESGPRSTISYDFRSFLSAKPGSVALVFGYGTAIFQSILKQRRIPHCVNMDGIEWQREKWGWLARRWLLANEYAAVGMADELVADHPEISHYLASRHDAVSTMIPYGVSISSNCDPLVAEHELVKSSAGRQFFLSIARMEPENQVHVALEGFRRSGSKAEFWVVGDADRSAYGRDLRREYPSARFVGAVYSAKVLDELRRRSLLYFHGHSVGGTNPSLIEAMAAGALVCAHDNVYNRWVLQDGGVYFSGVADLVARIGDSHMYLQRQEFISRAKSRCIADFSWPSVLGQYEQIVRRLECLAAKN